jgi:hypothetical protein
METFECGDFPAVKDRENLENDLGRVGQTTPVTLTQLEEALNQLFYQREIIFQKQPCYFFGSRVAKAKGQAI